MEVSSYERSVHVLLRLQYGIREFAGFPGQYYIYSIQIV